LLENHGELLVVFLTLSHNNVIFRIILRKNIGQKLKTILHTIDTTGPGGAETVFIDLATKLPKEKYRSVVVIRGKGWVYEELCRRGVDPILINAKGSFNWCYLLSLINLIRDEGVDLIQSHLLGANVYCSLAGMLTNTPVVATFHGAVDIGEKERFKGLKIGAINLGAKNIVAVSAGLQNDILNRTSLKRNLIKIIYNGIKCNEFDRARTNSIREKYGWTASDFIIGSLGNIRPAKGYDILLRTAALLANTRSKSYRFLIAGQPDKSTLYDDLLKFRDELGLTEKVIFLGFLDDPAEFLSNLDLFLSSSISEGLPLSAIQAMAAKLPLLATRCGGYEELVTHQENGWLVEIGNPKVLAAAIELLAEDPELRTSLASRAKKHVLETFDISVMLKEYEQMYDQMLRI
jgi:glycosyltransferase involved in cell wall biosynthesis